MREMIKKFKKNRIEKLNTIQERWCIHIKSIFHLILFSFTCMIIVIDTVILKIIKNFILNNIGEEENK